MAKCIRCGEDVHIGRAICFPCLKKWVKMRRTIFDILKSKYGKLSPSNRPIFIKETKRLERIWMKSKDQFDLEIKKLEETK